MYLNCCEISLHRSFHMSDGDRRYLCTSLYTESMDNLRVLSSGVLRFFIGFFITVYTDVP